MRILLQRVSEATVSIDTQAKASIHQGLLLLLGIEANDSLEDIDWLCQKVIKLRIFNDEAGKMNWSIKDIDGEIIVVSQFTLYANIKKGTRPSFIKAARPVVAIPLYQQFVKQLELLLGKPIGTGEFGANMQIQLINDGPVSLLLDSKNRSF